MTERKEGEDAQSAESALFIQQQVGRYIRRLRGDQKQETIARTAGIHVRTLGEIERGETDFQIGTVLRVLAAVGGNLSEAFHSRLPKSFKSPKHQELHEKLQELLDADPLWATAARINVEAVYGLYLRQKK